MYAYVAFLHASTRGFLDDEIESKKQNVLWKPVYKNPSGEKIRVLFFCMDMHAHTPSLLTSRLYEGCSVVFHMYERIDPFAWTSRSAFARLFDIA